ncbi:MAG: arginine deiminase family protein, partial [Candidatus Bathyarchaeia archaeon]
MVNYGITHESGRLERVLVHHPGAELEEANRDPIKHHFEKPVDIGRFIQEHKHLIESLNEAGVEVLNVREIVGEAMGEAIKKCPNLVFTRDSSSVTNAGAILMRMGLPSRRLETLIIKAVYKAIGVPVGIQLEEPETFEGGGFALLDDGVAVAGLCSRTTRRALELVKDFLFRERLVDLF